MTLKTMLCKFCACKNGCELQYYNDEVILQRCPESLHNVVHIAVTLKLEGHEKGKVTHNHLKGFIEEHSN